MTKKRYRKRRSWPAPKGLLLDRRYKVCWANDSFLIGKQTLPGSALKPIHGQPLTVYFCIVVECDSTRWGGARLR